MLHESRTFPKTYNYYDYIHGLKTPRVYGNGQGKYSWWIQFEISNPLEEFPNWFRYRFFYQGINSISIASIYARNI